MTVAVSKAVEDGARGRDLRVDREHGASAGRVRGPGRDPGGRADRRRARSPARSSRRRACSGRRVLEVGATSTRRSTRPGARPTEARTCSSTRSTRTAARARRRPPSRSSRSSAARPTRSCSRTAAAATPSAVRAGLRRARRSTTPLVSVEAVDRPRHARLRDPDRRARARARRVDERAARGVVAVADDEILDAWRELAAEEGLFCEPSSAAGLAPCSARDVERASASSCVDHRPRAQGPGGRRRRYAPPPVTVEPDPDAIAGRGATPVSVRAPATSANLGPGFDCAAVALDLWNELEVTDGEGVVVEGEGAGELAADATNLARPRLRAPRRPGGQALPVHQPDPARARARLVGGGDRARASRRRGRDGDRRGAARRRASSSRATRTTSPPRSSGGVCADLGRPDRPDRGDAAARTRRRRPARAHVDGGVAQRAARDASRTPTPLQRAAARRCSARAPPRATPSSSPPGSTTACTSRTGRRPCSTRSGPSLPPGARGATLSGSGPTVIVWAATQPSLRGRARRALPRPRRAVLAVAPRGAL